MRSGSAGGEVGLKIDPAITELAARNFQCLGRKVDADAPLEAGPKFEIFIVRDRAAACVEQEVPAALEVGVKPADTSAGKCKRHFAGVDECARVAKDAVGVAFPALFIIERARLACLRFARKCAISSMTG